MITLVKDTIKNEDIDELVDWLKTYPRLTKGKETLKLEQDFSKWLGKKYSVFCNSGSSANLLMLASLIEGDFLKKGAKVVVPTLCWATDLMPVMQLGFKPILCDINMKDLSVDLNELEKIFKEEKPDAFLYVSILGLPTQYEKIISLCEKYKVMFLEDACEALGSTYQEKKVGSFGLMSTFSTYFGHHISTIEGGFVSTDNEDLYNILLSIRSHGWARDLNNDTAKQLKEKWNIGDFNDLYTFYYSGFNLRSTDLQAIIGQSQLKRIYIVSERSFYNYNLYNKLIRNDFWEPEIPKNSTTSNFAFPVISPNRDKIVKELIENKVETRPLICGSMGSQPFYVKEYGEHVFANASIVDSYGFYLPNHQNLNDDEVRFVASIVNKYI